MRGKWSVLRQTVISIYHNWVKVMYECGHWIKVWGTPDMFYLYYSRDGRWYLEHLIDGRDPDVPSEDENQPISCRHTGKAALKARQSRRDVPLSGPVLLVPSLISGLLMSSCIDVSMLFHFSYFLHVQKAIRQQQTATVKWYTVGHKMVSVLITFQTKQDVCAI